MKFKLGCYSNSNNPTGVSKRLLKFALKHKDFKYFSNLLQFGKDGSNIVSDLEICAKHLKNLSEDFKGTL